MFAPMVTAIACNQGRANAEPEPRENLQDALRRYEQAIATNPDQPEAYRAHARVLFQLRRYEDALAGFDKAIELQPDSALAHSDRGNALLALKRFEGAVVSYGRAIALKPDYAPAYNNRGNALKNLRRYNEALESYNQAIALLPDRSELYNNRGNVLQELEQYEEAVESYDAALALAPDYVEAYSNRGAALYQLKRLDEAIASFDRALLLKPDHPETCWNKALLSLLCGQFATGWREYEARTRKRDPAVTRVFDKPLWLNDAGISGKTILIHWEQGYGDVIFSSRYVGLCQRAGARVLFAPQRPLQALMRGLNTKVHIVDLESDSLLFDHHCPIMSLPLAFGTELATIPSESYLSADKDKVSAWSRWLGKKNRPRVGVVWSRTGLPDKGRSIPLELFERLFDRRFEFVCLQKFLTNAECARLDRAGVIHPGEALVDFSDTAALCCLMDLIISIDTSVAHLAGALGAPVWILLPWLPAWIWMLDRDDSPWYPSMRLFRQQARGDWDGVLQRVQLELTAALS